MESSNSAILKELTPKEFLGVGLHQIAYIRSQPAGFSIHAADGTQLSVLATYNEAVNAARAGDLHPVTLQ